jgi:SAM-dependent methyltransferase
MLRSIADRHVWPAAASAEALPLPRHTAGAVLAMHMLYHLPDPQAGLTELRRVVRPGGLLVASTNDDLADGLWSLFREVGLDHVPVSARWPLSSAAATVHAAGFGDVAVRTFDYVLDIPAVQPVLDYLDSCRTGFPQIPDDRWTDIRQTLAARLATHLRRHDFLRRAGRVGLITARHPGPA